MDTWKLAGRTWSSRIIVGTGKYASLDETRAALAASGAEVQLVVERRHWDGDFGWQPAVPSVT